MSAPLDQSRAVRSGEELDVERLSAHLHDRLAIAGPVSVEQFPAGHSNLTYLLRTADGKELILRRPPFGNRVRTAHDMGREVTVLTALNPVFPQAPKPLLHEEDEAVIGAPFYVMERCQGTILRRKLPEGLVLSEALLARLGESFIDTLVQLHEIPYEKIGLGTWGKPEGYVARQVQGWSKRYAAAKTDEIADIDAVMRWLPEHLPNSPAPSLIHNDYKLDNLVLDPNELTRIVGVLDWEMSTIGDPLMDLGTALAWWIEATDPAPLQAFTFGPTNLPGSPTRRELVAMYAARRPGVDLSELRFYYAFSLFKNAVVAQQIYARFVAGHTQDPRFAAMILGVRLLSETANGVIEGGDL